MQVSKQYRYQMASVGFHKNTDRVTGPWWIIYHKRNCSTLNSSEIFGRTRRILFCKNNVVCQTSFSLFVYCLKNLAKIWKTPKINSFDPLFGQPTQSVYLQQKFIRVDGLSLTMAAFRKVIYFVPSFFRFHT